VGPAVFVGFIFQTGVAAPTGGQVGLSFLPRSVSLSPEELKRLTFRIFIYYYFYLY